jgi:hypothetical protein
VSSFLTTFGPLVRRVVRERLGLAIPAAARGSWQALEEHAERVLNHWGDWYQRASARVARLSQDPAAPEWWDRRAKQLVLDIYHAGLRAWLCQVMEAAPGQVRGAARRQVQGAATRISTPADLRCWCSLLLRANEVVEDAYPVPIWGGPRRRMLDADLLETVEPTLWAEDSKEVYKALGELSCTRAEDWGPDWDDYCEHLNIEGVTPVPDKPDWPFWDSLARQARQHLRRLSRAGTGVAAEASKGMAKFSDWRVVLHQVMTSCRQQGGEPTDRAADPGTARPAARARKNAPAKRSWTQPELDDAIRKYKAERASRYHDLVEGVRKGLPGARKDARRLYGRNAIVDALGVRAPAMVSKSPAWKLIAEDLDLLRKPKAKRPLGQRKRVGYDIAEEEKAEAMGDPTAEAVDRREVIQFIQDNKRQMKEGCAKELLANLEGGKISPDTARDLAELAIQQKTQDTPKSRSAP